MNNCKYRWTRVSCLSCVFTTSWLVRDFHVLYFQSTHRSHNNYDKSKQNKTTELTKTKLTPGVLKHGLHPNRLKKLSIKLRLLVKIVAVSLETTIGENIHPCSIMTMMMTTMIIIMIRRPDRTISTSGDVSCCIRYQLITPDMRKRRPAELAIFSAGREEGRDGTRAGRIRNPRTIGLYNNPDECAVRQRTCRQTRDGIYGRRSSYRRPASATRKAASLTVDRHRRGFPRVSDSCLVSQGLSRALLRRRPADTNVVHRSA